MPRIAGFGFAGNCLIVVVFPVWSFRFTFQFQFNGYNRTGNFLLDLGPNVIPFGSKLYFSVPTCHDQMEKKPKIISLNFYCIHNYKPKMTRSIFISIHVNWLIACQNMFR